MNGLTVLRMLKDHLRLLPVVMALCGVLLAVKGASIVDEARAAVAAAAAGGGAAADPATPKPADSKPAAASDATDPASSENASEVDVLTSLGKRRRALDDEARQLDMRANLLAATEKRIDGKIAELKALQGQIQVLLSQRDDAQKKQITALVKVYSAMKPADAGRLFNALDDGVLVDVAAGMKPDVLAGIMAAMNPEKAQALTLKLADRLNLPTKASAVSASPQLAAGAPSAPPAGSAGTAPAAPPQQK